MLHRLVYTSTSKKLLDDRELQKILRSARNHNLVSEITGLLIYHDGCFLQVLEGEEEAVKACFKRINKDPRHQDCIVLANEPAVSRMFSQWWMSYRAYDDLSGQQRKQFIGLQSFATHARKADLTQDNKTNAILLAFLSTFRDLDMAG